MKKEARTRRVTLTRSTDDQFADCGNASVAIQSLAELEREMDLKRQVTPEKQKPVERKIMFEEKPKPSVAPIPPRRRRTLFGDFNREVLTQTYLTELFSRYDTDHSGFLEMNELPHALSSVGLHLTVASIEKFANLFGIKDVQDGINKEEFVGFVLKLRKMEDKNEESRKLGGSHDEVKQRILGRVIRTVFLINLFILCYLVYLQLQNPIDAYKFFIIVDVVISSLLFCLLVVVPIVKIHATGCFDGEHIEQFKRQIAGFFEKKKPEKVHYKIRPRTEATCKPVQFSYRTQMDPLKWVVENEMIVEDVDADDVKKQQQQPHAPPVSFIPKTGQSIQYSKKNYLAVEEWQSERDDFKCFSPFHQPEKTNVTIETSLAETGCNVRELVLMPRQPPFNRLLLDATLSPKNDSGFPSLKA